MQNKLRALFEYQRFENNEHLARIIDETENRRVELSDDALFYVNAAGELPVQKKPEIQTE